MEWRTLGIRLDIPPEERFSDLGHVVALGATASAKETGERQPLSATSYAKEEGPNMKKASARSPWSLSVAFLHHRLVHLSADRKQLVFASLIDPLSYHLHEVIEQQVLSSIINL